MASSARATMLPLLLLLPVLLLAAAAAAAAVLLPLATGLLGPLPEGIEARVLAESARVSSRMGFLCERVMAQM